MVLVDFYYAELDRRRAMARVAQVILSIIEDGKSGFSMGLFCSCGHMLAKLTNDKRATDALLYVDGVYYPPPGVHQDHLIEYRTGNALTLLVEVVCA